MPQLARPPLPVPPIRQLAVPLVPPDAEAPRSSTPAMPVIAITTQQVWTTRSPTAQAQLRQTVLRILQEVVHAAPEC
jgi:hypothetical protein